MNRKQLMIAWSMMLVFAFSLFAQEKNPIDKFKEDCVSKDYTTAGMTNCIYEAEKKWDVELNKYYELLKGILNKEAQQALRDAQRKWIKYRDAQFIYIDKKYPELGTMYINMRAADRKEVVRQRALELKSEYETLEQVNK